MATKNLNINVKTKGAKQAETGFKKLGGVVKDNIGGFVSLGIAIAGVARFSTEAIKKFAQQELAEKKLEQAIGRRSQALLNQASALQRVTTYGDEAIIEAQALIGSFVKEEAAIKDATAATLDLAAAKGMDLTAAADLMSKTLGSSTNALVRYGIQVEGAVGSSERLKSLTENIAKVFGGQASAQAATLSGRMQTLSNSFGDFQENLGKVFSEIDQNSGLLEKLTFFFDELAGNNDTQAKALASRVDAEKRYRENVALLTDEQKKQLEGLRAFESAKLAEKLAQQNRDLTESTEDASQAFTDFVEKQDEARAKAEQLAEFTARYNEQLAHQNGLMWEVGIVTANNVELTEQWVEKLQGVEAVSTEVGDTYIKDVAEKIEARNRGLFTSISGTFSGILTNSKGVFAGIRDAFFSMVTDMVAKAAAFGVLSLFGAAPAGGFLSNILPFAKGGDFVTNGPQLIMVGDNPGGRERVTVTPQSSANVNGPQERNVVINFNAPVTDRQYVNNYIIPEIQRSVRLGQA